MKIAFYTLGCKVNQYETNVMIEKFINNKHEIVQFDEKADIYIINTCTVTNMSDRKSRQIIHRAKKKNQNAIVVVVGCLAQTAPEELEKIEEIDLVLGNEEKKNIIEHIEKFLKNRKINVCVSDISKCNKYEVEELATFYEKTRATIKIQDGCNNFCSYCIIPYARGRVRSKPLDDVINETMNIAKNGYKELVITGIHVCSYGQDLENVSLITLLEKLNKIDGIERIRLSSLEPNILTEQFIIQLSKLQKVCPHFHLSIQSGCDQTLKRMNRKYLANDLIRIVNDLKKVYKDVNITADVIVGFPGETDEEFNSTKELLSKLKLNKLHVFQYSKRKGTVAASMKEQVDANIKHERSKQLIQLSNSCQEEILKEYIGKTVEILTEDFANTRTKGFTRNYLHCYINKEYKPNMLLKCVVKGIDNDMLVCEEI